MSGHRAGKPPMPPNAERRNKMKTLKANYDLIGTASTAGVLLIVNAPWPFWAVWAAVSTYQIGNRILRGWDR